MIDFNLPLGVALLTVCAAIAVQALRLFRQGRHVPAHHTPDVLELTLADLAPDAADIFRAAEIDHARQQELQQALASHQAELAQAQATIARASDHVRRAGLTFAVTYLWEELAAGCALVKGAELVDETTWRWQDSLWQITREPLASTNPARPMASFSLLVDGETVLAIACQRDPESVGHRFIAVEALELGPWVARLVDFAGTLRTALELARARQQAAATLRTASRIRLVPAPVPAAA